MGTVRKQQQEDDDSENDDTTLLMPHAVRLSYRSFSFHDEETDFWIPRSKQQQQGKTTTGGMNATCSSPSRKRGRRRDAATSASSSASSTTSTDAASLAPIFLALGVGVLLPWNAYIMAKPYFAARLAGLAGHSSLSSSCHDTTAIDSTSALPVLTADSMEAWFSLLFNAGSVVSLAILIAVQFWCHATSTTSATGNGKSRSMSTKQEGNTTTTNTNTNTSSNNIQNWYLVMVPLGIYLVVFVGTTLLVLLPSVPWLWFCGWTFLGFTVCGVCTSIASAGIVSAACQWQEQVGIHPYFNGQAVGGLLVALGNFGANYLEGRETTTTNTQLFDEYDDPSLPCRDHDEVAAYSTISWPTAGYFAVSCLVLAACMVGYSVVDQSMNHSESASYSIDSDDYDDDMPAQESTRLLPPVASDDEQDDEEETFGSSPGFYYCVQKSKKSSYEDTASTSSETNSTAGSSLEEEEDLEDPLSPSPSCPSESKDNTRHPELSNLTIQVIRAIWGPALSLFGTFFLTLVIFPVWTSELSSIRRQQDDDDHDSSMLLMGRLHNDLYTPLTFVVFNAGDLLGRMLSSVEGGWALRSSSSLVGASLLRFIFVFLFLFCHSTSSSANSKDTAWEIHSDSYSWIVQLTMAISNGYLTNIAFSVAPTLVEANVMEKTAATTARSQQIASAVLNFAMSSGLLCGSACSFYYLEFAKSV
jgi:hypothetical protein